MSVAVAAIVGKIGKGREVFIAVKTVRTLQRGRWGEAGREARRKDKIP